MASASNTIKMNLYGGNQQEYKKVSAETIQKGVSFLQGELSKADVNGKNLFFTILETFSAARAQVAKIQKTPNAKLFGHRRDAEGALPEYFTYLDQQYLSYGDRLKTLIGKQLPELMKNEKPKSGNQECQIHFRTFDIPSVKGTQKSEEFKTKTAIPVKDLETASDLISAIAYQKESLMQHCIFNLPPNLLRFVSAQLFWKLEDKLTPVTEYLCIYDATLSPEDAVEALKENPEQEGTWMIQNKPCVMIKHMDKELIKSGLERIASIFERIVTRKNPDEATLKADLAEFVYNFSFVMPYERGSAAINEWFQAALAQLHGYKSSFPEDRMSDFEALSTPYFPNFKKKYVELLNLTILKRAAC